MKKISFPFIFMTFIVFLFFYKSLFVYFVQDDFYYFNIIKNIPIWNIWKIFIPLSDAVWYRPVSAQLFFFIFKWLFGLKPTPYHLLVLLTHAAIGFVIYLLIFRLSKQKLTALVAGYFYCINQNFSIALSWLATYAFVLAPFGISLMLYFYFKQKPLKAFLFFLLAALSFEVSLIMPAGLIVYEFIILKKIQWQYWWPYFLIIGLIIFLRKFLFVTSIQTELYSYSISILNMATLKFYLFRLAGIPMSIDQFPAIQKILIYIFNGILLATCIYGGIRIFRKKWPSWVLLFCIIGILGILPFILLVNHIAPYYMSMALLGWVPIEALLIITALDKLKKNLQLVLIVLIIVMYSTVQYLGIEFTYKNHWIFQRAKRAETLIKSNQLTQSPGSEEYFALGADAAEKAFSN